MFTSLNQQQVVSSSLVNDVVLHWWQLKFIFCVWKLLVNTANMSKILKAKFGALPQNSRYKVH